MAETPRTYAELQTALADNTTRAITPEDVRDLMASAMSCYGAMAIVADTAPPQGLNELTWTVISGWDQIQTQSNMTVDLGASSTTVLYEGVYQASVSLSFELDGKDTMRLGLSVNGAPPASGGFGRKVQNASDLGSMSALTQAPVLAGDIITVVGKLTDGTANITSHTAVFAMSRIG